MANHKALLTNALDMGLGMATGWTGV